MSDAVMVGVFTLSGVVLSSGLTWFTSFLQHRRATHEFEQREKRQDRVRLADLRREAVIGVAQSWAKVVQADAARMEARIEGEDDPGRSPTVEPLTDLGLNLNKLLVLPIGAGFEEKVYRVESVVGEFRDSYDDATKRVQRRKDAGASIVKLIEAAREEGTV